MASSPEPRQVDNSWASFKPLPFSRSESARSACRDSVHLRRALPDRRPRGEHSTELGSLSKLVPPAPEERESQNPD